MSETYFLVIIGMYAIGLITAIAGGIFYCAGNNKETVAKASDDPKVNAGEVGEIVAVK